MNDRLRVLDVFLRLSLGEGPEYRISRGEASERLVEEGVFDWMVDRFETVGPTEVDSDSTIGPACVYETGLGDLDRATIYMSTLAPWALIKTYSLRPEPALPVFTGVHTVASSSTEVRPIVDAVTAVGFQLTSAAECVATSPYRGYNKGFLNYFELLFQASGYFDSPWDTVL